MAVSDVDSDLQSRLDELRRSHGDAVKIDQIADILRVLMAGMRDPEPADPRLYRELESLASYIHAAKAEIAALRPQDISNQYIASATDELDAIVVATESATNKILDAAEKIEDLVAAIPDDAARRLSEATTSIYEACNFQDITGQRITKVVKVLKDIERKVDALVQAFAPDAAVAAPPPGKPEGKPSDADLLNGPQLPDKATKQAEIDALLASFD